MVLECFGKSELEDEFFGIKDLYIVFCYLSSIWLFSFLREGRSIKEYFVFGVLVFLIVCLVLELVG